MKNSESKIQNPKSKIQNSPCRLNTPPYYNPPMLAALYPLGPSLAFTIMATLTIVLAAAVAAFTALVRQATLGRQAERIRQWAQLHHAHVEQLTDQLPPRLAMLALHHPKILLAISGETWTLARITTDAPAEAKGEIPRWHLLAVDLPSSWPATGLRPVSHVVSILDLAVLSSFPSLTTGENFVVFGADSGAADALSHSIAQELLPADVGLLLHDRTLLLDFSGREFEGPEMNRILDIARILLPELAACWSSRTSK
jgi:hypothetical protein